MCYLCHLYVVLDRIINVNVSPWVNVPADIENIAKCLWVLVM